MSRSDDIKKLLTLYYRRLQKRKEAVALHGISVEPSILIEIEDIEEKIDALKHEMANLPNEGPEDDTADDKATVHVLHQYPRGPMVEGHLIDYELMEACANAIRPHEAPAIVAKANALRRQADPDDDTVTLIQVRNLPPPQSVSPTMYWMEVFNEARLNGPRMLAALLLSVPETQFPAVAQKSRKELLRTLRDEY